MKKHKFSSLWQKIITGLASVRLTIILLVILIPASILGTVIPQGLSYHEYVSRFGETWLRVLHFFWLSDIFTSFWFVGLGLLLAVNLLVCTLVSWQSKKARIGFFITHASLLLLIIGSLVSGLWRVSGDVQIHEGETVNSFYVHEKEVPLGFELKLKDFELQKYTDRGETLTIQIQGQESKQDFHYQLQQWTPVSGTSLQFQVTHFIPDFRIDHTSGRVFSASQEPRNPAIRVHVKGDGVDYEEWVFHHFPDMHRQGERPLKLRYLWAPFVPKDFLSHLQVFKGDQLIKEKTIEVNDPLRYNGFTLYQMSYDTESLHWSGLRVVKDPGVALVYLGIIGIMVGMLINIYIRPFIEKRSKEK